MLIKKNKFKTGIKQEEILFEDDSIFDIEHEKNGTTEIDEEKIVGEIFAVQQRLTDLENEFQAKKAQAENEVHSIIHSARENSEKIIQSAEDIKAKANQEIALQRQELQKEKNNFANLKEKEIKDAYDQGMKQATDVVVELMNVLATFNQVKRNIIVESKKEIISIALDFAKQIVGYEIKVNDNFLQDQIERSITKLANTKGLIQVFINPQELSKISKIEEALARILDPAVKLIFQKDEKVDLGSCVINTQGGRMDSSFSTQIRILKEALEKYLGYEIEDLVEINEQDNIEENLELQEIKVLDNNIIAKEKELEDEDMAVLELQDSKELGANDIDEKEIKLSDDDDDFDDEDPDEDFEEEDDEDSEEEEYLDDDEDEDEEEDDEDFDEDEDFEEEEEEEKDDRFPEY